MKEKTLKRKLSDLLITCGYFVWFPAKVMYNSETDIFGVYDCIAYDGIELRWIQMTTLTNVSHRRKKMYARFPGVPLPRDSWIYAWDGTRFREIKI